jgi:hypothetical protein
VVGTALAMGFGLNVPHCPAGRQLNCTSALSGPFVTIAAIPAVSLVSSAVGGRNSVLNVTTIAGAWYLGSPQAVRRVIMAVVIMVVTIIVVTVVVVTIMASRKLDRGKIIRWFDASSESEV